jgi:WD40 repeat protein
MHELKVPLGYATNVRFHPRRPDLLAAGSNDRRLRLWQLSAHGPPQLVSDAFRGFHDTPSSVAFDASGERIAAGAYDRTVRMWNITSGEEPLVVYRAEEPVNAIAFDGKGNLRAGLDDGQVVGWRERPDALITIAAQASSRAGIGYLASGPTLVSAADKGVLCFWDARTGRAVGKRRVGNGWISSLSTAARVERLAWQCEGEICTAAFRLDDPRAANVLAKTGASLVAFSPDGRRLAAIQPLTEERDRNAVAQLSFAMGAALYDVDGRRRLWIGDGDATCLAFTPQGELVTACRGGLLQVIDRAGRWRATWSSAAGQDLCCVAISPAGARLAAACDTGQVLLCRIPDDKLVWRIRDRGDGPLQVAFSPDGKTLASGGAGGQVRLWDPITGAERAHLTVSHSILRMAFGPDSNSLAVLTDDGSLHVWHAGR